jgi:hypothetical protein
MEGQNQITLLAPVITCRISRGRGVFLRLFAGLLPAGYSACPFLRSLAAEPAQSLRRLATEPAQSLRRFLQDSPYAGLLLSLPSLCAMRPQTGYGACPVPT